MALFCTIISNISPWPKIFQFLCFFQAEKQNKLTKCGWTVKGAHLLKISPQNRHNFDHRALVFLPLEYHKAQNLKGIQISPFASEAPRYIKGFTCRRAHSLALATHMAAWFEHHHSSGSYNKIPYSRSGLNSKYFSLLWRRSLRSKCWQGLVLTGFFLPCRWLLFVEFSQVESTSDSLTSLSIRTLFPTRGPTLMTLLKSNYLPKGPSSNTLALGLQYTNWGGRGEAGYRDRTPSIMTTKPPFPHLWNKTSESLFHRVVERMMMLWGQERREWELHKCGFVGVQMRVARWGGGWNSLQHYSSSSKGCKYISYQYAIQIPISLCSAVRYKC